MNKQRSRRLSLFAYFCLGSAVGLYLVYLLVHELGSAGSLAAVAHALPVAAAVIPCFLIPLWAATQSWRLLFPQSETPALRPALVLTWIGLSVNWLLPVALVGGELVKFRLSLHRLSRTDYLVASLIGDKTIQVATQLLYTVLGLSVLALLSDEVAGGVGETLGLVIFGAAVYLFYRLQRAGLFGGVARRLKAFVQNEARVELGAARIDKAIDEMYQRGGRWWYAVGWRLLFRVLLAIEVVLVLWWFDEPVSLWPVLALESVAQAARVAALVIPGALGVQETVIVAAGLLLGYPAEALLTLAVVKRARELVVGGSGLLAWQCIEAGRWREDRV